LSYESRKRVAARDEIKEAARQTDNAQSTAG
jgi:hypothetical protein